MHCAVPYLQHYVTYCVTLFVNALYVSSLSDWTALQTYNTVYTSARNVHPLVLQNLSFSPTINLNLSVTLLVNCFGP